MGKFRSYPGDRSERVSICIEDCIPEDHLVRIIDEIVDMLDIKELTKNYSERGEEAYYPAVMLKIIFYGYCVGIFTSRKMQKALEYDLCFRWLAQGQVPNFRTISDFRKDNLKQLASIFTQIVKIAMDMGYATLKHVSIDGSKIKANASKHKAMSRDRMKEEIVRLEKEIFELLQKAQKVDEDEEKSSVSFKERIPGEIQRREDRLERIKASLKELEERKPEAEKGSTGKDQINFTDSESRIMDTKTQGVIQAYNPQIGVDSENGIIVGLTNSNNANYQKQLKGVLESIKLNTGENPEIITADSGYFSADNILACEEKNIDAYIASGREGKVKGNTFDKTNFMYQPENDIYICPKGRVLTLKQVQNENKPDKPTRWVYECDGCPGCDFNKDCVKAKSGKRTVTRTEQDPVREKMRTKVQSDEGKAVYKNRKAIVEPVWGQVKESMGFRQFHMRGEEKTEGEIILIAISYNLRKFHSIRYPKQETIWKRRRSALKYTGLREEKKSA